MHKNRRKKEERKSQELSTADSTVADDSDDSTLGTVAHPSLSNQDRRLSNKHMKALTFLQAIINENKDLKARIAELEVTISQSIELVAMANQCPQPNHDSRGATEEINTMLLDEHRTELLRVITENMELGNKWKLEKTFLEEEITRLTKALANLPSDLCEANETSDRAQMIRLKLEALSEENEILKVEHSRLHEENMNLRFEVEASSRIRQENDKLENDIAYANQSFKELKLKYEKLLKNIADDDGKNELLNKVKNKLTKLTAERRVLTERGLQCEKMLSAYDDQVQRLEQSRGELLVEISSLRDQVQTKRQMPSVDRDFKEFVSVKRELASLREENLALASRVRPRSRTQSMLPMLKAHPDDKSGDQRRFSVNSGSGSSVYNRPRISNGTTVVSEMIPR